MISPKHLWIRPALLSFVLMFNYALPQSHSSPYSLRWSTDGPTIGTSLLVAATAFSDDNNISPLTVAEINALKKNDINTIDRISAGNYSNIQSVISDVLVGGSIASPLLFLFDNSMNETIMIISVMYMETIIFSHFLPSLAKDQIGRIRPYVYGDGAALSEKQSSDAQRSFFSGHATWAFATGIFFSTVYTDYHPNSEYNKYIWGGAIGLATSISLLRVTSGSHFISDIAAGAVVGSTIGYLIPLIHRRNSDGLSLRPYISMYDAGIALSLRLK